MVPEGEERSGKFDDLFEDLDRFFAPGNPGPGRRGSGAGEAKEEEPAEDLLPPGWEPDIEGLDLGADPGADAPASDRGRMGSHVEGAAGGEPGRGAARPGPSDAEEIASAKPPEDELPEGV